MWIGHRKEIRKLTFWALALRRSEWLERWPIHIIIPVDKTKLPCYTSHRRSTAVSLETYPSIHTLMTTSGFVFQEPKNMVTTDITFRDFETDFSQIKKKRCIKLSYKVEALQLSLQHLFWIGKFQQNHFLQ